MYVYLCKVVYTTLLLDAHRSSPNPTSVKEVEESGPALVEKVDLSVTVERASDDSSPNDVIQKKQPPNKASTLVCYYNVSIEFVGPSVGKKSVETIWPTMLYVWLLEIRTTL